MWGLCKGKNGSPSQIALFFLFYQNFHSLLPTAYVHPPANLILPNVPIPHLLELPVYS